MDRDIRRYNFITLNSKEEFDKVHTRGWFDGPGLYVRLDYDEPCPRGCCRQDVVEVIPIAEFSREMSELVREFFDVKRRELKAYHDQLNQKSGAEETNQSAPVASG